MNDTLTETQWQTAHKIAIELVKSETDPNEVSKANSYLRSTIEQPNEIAKFFKYIGTLVSSGDKIGHSRKTVKYYQNISTAYKKHLSNQDNPQAMMQILGWVSRLMRYYKTAPIAELDAKLLEKTAQQLEVGDITEAKVISKKDKGKEVTYEIIGTSIRRNNKEPKKFETLSIDQVVKVEILEVDDGIPKKFKRVD
ncbi:hypothetical protein [Pseudanabaena sp. UWO310]|uniref:hypothetical protein n=1 Tax=Pseudanabaena sp. UWO310 TaxID=2480795 RepID=UPI00116025CC|nr:hypothetical protein [Pseudanabaena sp. UWO310]TYQ24955.1 hypothetical protein PseudUWO310_20085 [Pseudanabaena sp. UWO310]